MSSIALFGIRSPLAVEYEETCDRAGIELAVAVSLDNAPRIIAIDRVVDLVDLRPHHRTHPYLVCAFSPQRRRELVSLAHNNGFQTAGSLIDPTSTIAKSTTIGAGTYINAGCVIGGVARIGEHVVVNRASSLGHHSVLEDFVTIGPGVTVAGNIRIGNGTIIGAGSTILPDLRIGSGSIIAAGSVVRRNVPDGVFVAGNPAIEKTFNFAQNSLNIPGGE